jgi:hypothetical protein
MGKRMSEKEVVELLQGEGFDALPEPSPELRERILRMPLEQGVCEISAVDERDERIERVCGLSIPLESETGESRQQDFPSKTEGER